MFLPEFCILSIESSYRQTVQVDVLGEKKFSRDFFISVRFRY